MFQILGEVSYLENVPFALDGTIGESGTYTKFLDIGI